jgi:hypothetical protein
MNRDAAGVTWGHLFTLPGRLDGGHVVQRSVKVNPKKLPNAREAVSGKGSIRSTDDDPSRDYYRFFFQYGSRRDGRFSA